MRDEDRHVIDMVSGRLGEREACSERVSEGVSDGVSESG